MHQTETDAVQNLIDDFFLTLTVEDLSIGRILSEGNYWGLISGLISEKNGSFVCRT